jgi:hypothetical protein
MRSTQTGLVLLMAAVAVACSAAKGGGGTGGTAGGETSARGGATDTGGAGSGASTGNGGTPGKDAPDGQDGSTTCATQKWNQTNWPADNKYFSLHAGQDRVFARTWDALNGGRTFLSSDDGATWIQVGSADTDMDMLSIAMSNNSVLAGTWNDLLQSTSGGASFNISTPTGIPVDTAIWSMAAIGSTLLAGTKEDVYRSSDNGSTWTELKAGIPANAIVTSIIASGDSFLAGTDTAGVLTMPKAGTNWTTVGSVLANAHISQLAVLDTRLFAVTPDGVFVSSNDGSSWTADTSGLGDVNCLLVLGGRLLAGTDNSGVQLSADSGLTWTSFSAGMPSGTRVWSLAATSNSIFAGTNSGVWRVHCSN